MAALGRRKLRIGCCASLLACSATPLWSQDFAAAARLSEEGRCPEVVALLEAESDAAALRLRGLCWLRMGDYARASADLERVRSSDPSADVDLAIALYHSGERERAEELLRAAEARGERRPELALYLGLAALDRSQPGPARSRFESARLADASAVEPGASYYEGVASARSGERAAARDAFERVVREYPGTSWADAAARGLADLGVEARPWFASARLGFEYDSNAVLRGAGVVLPEEIPNQDDERLVWGGSLGAVHAASPDLSVGASLAYAGSAYRKLTDFDFQTPALTLWADRRLGERATLRALASYGYAWVGGDGFLSSPGGALELYVDWQERGITRTFFELASDDYKFETEVLPHARDRDGIGFRLGAAHEVRLAAHETTLSAALAYRVFDSEGTEYSFDSPELEMGFLSALPFGLMASGGVGFAYRSYWHPSTYATPASDDDRREHEWRTELSLGRAWGQLGVEARWRYQRNHSNVDVFDYKRHVAGLYLTWSLAGG